ncbi:tRNA preQ1(34) S-adenosylmethionine ribosyltransferase-isomerase QueA [Romeria aff. gracilis LEGE 07310]|uniref:S-adenosylmethionine:tRNA ribosyltransferase-isomerase n=1 Tax=Vasconcelosia minhoensis LEGE 07310 TaxID=915328 RepID=A0A8J7A9N4_9CYAN|nr:tRNA preQ1(34) S-adenosylmethionine ribosyltransferase-isomerase QueA [Romeria gracilis]MBE9075749.1 tRNA preQ1(34) S-adenosylmethionine ribosyltransferase-isomerase QueA [Romeria aff. gracilis LEGE 07310]
MYPTASSSDLSLAAYRYHLPEALIAQNPAAPRDSARLLLVDSPKSYQHRRFSDLPDLLQPKDLLVLNNTRVMPARLQGRKPSGGEVEVLLLEPASADCWLALVKPGRRLKPGSLIEFGELPEVPLLVAQVEDCDRATGGRILRFESQCKSDVESLLHQLGTVPLPPYITQSQSQPEQYQTVFAQRLGSAAAPTAGLHFTPALFDRLKTKGIQTAFVTLHVGVGTFRPVETADITAHQMHREWAEVPAETAALVQQTKANGGRVIAVGTTSTRALEGAAHQKPMGQPFRGRTDLFIYPGYRWRVVDGLVTNFHLPESSLLMLVSSLIGRERLLQLYQAAIESQYRFYSFGDAMLILPEAVLSPQH